MKFKETKEESFESIYKKNAVDVYRASMHIVDNEAVANEIMQQAFLNFRNRKEPVKPECVKSYLITIARNLSKNHIRRTWREVGYETYTDEEGVEAVVEPSTESLEDVYFEDYRREERRKLSNQILEDLKGHNEEWYQILYRITYLEKSHDEIAEELGITKDVLYSRLYRARNWAREKYQTKLDELDEGD